MEIVPLTPMYLEEMKAFLEEMEEEFLAFREDGEHHDIEEYLQGNGLQMFLAVEDEKIVGYSACKKYPDRNSCRWASFAIHKDYRGRDFERKLAGRSLEWFAAQGVDDIIARTWASNTKARRSLECMKFRQYDEIPDDRVNGESTIWYRKEL